MKKHSKAGGRYSCTVIITVGGGEEEALKQLRRARITLRSHRGKNVSEIAAMLLSRSIRQRLGAVRANGMFFPVLQRVVGSIIYNEPSIPEISAEIDRLWSYGISADHPTVVLTLTGEAVTPSVENLVRAFVSVHKYLALSGVKLDTVFVIRDNGEYVNPHRALILRAAEECGCTYLLNHFGGIFTVPEGECGKILRGVGVLSLELNPSFVIDTLLAKRRFRASQTVPVTAPQGRPFIEEGIYTTAGVFTDRGFSVRKTDLDKSHPPLSFVYSCGHFGTLVTDSSLGYTWIGNCHERRITQFLPDPLLCLDGERLIGRISDVEYDLVSCSHTADFGFDYAIWTGEVEGISYTVTAYIDPHLPCKIITVKSSEGISLEMRIKPVLGDVPRHQHSCKN